MARELGYRVVGTVTSQQGTCSMGHKVGDKFELSLHSCGGLCGLFYHDIFPTITMLQFGGSLPSEWEENADVLERECPDRLNILKMELRRIR
jgi:uncharacterized repeat protein (TIGR04076 family)